MPSLPDDLAEALKQNGLSVFFKDCTGPHQREYLKWIADAKKPETRKTRIAQAMKMISEKQRQEAAKRKK